MIQEESGLFQVRFTEEGKKYIRKFAAISSVMLVLVLFESAISIYWNIKSLMQRSGEGVAANFTADLYYKIIPCFLILTSFFSVISNIYYLRFPRVLLHSIESNDEPAANNAFGILFKGAFVFLIWLLLVSIIMVWSLTINQVVN